MSRIQRLLRTIHERSLWQVAGSYLLGSWAAVQVADTVGSLLGLPDGFMRATAVLLLAGLPPALVVAAALTRHQAAAGATSAGTTTSARTPPSWRRVAPLMAFAALAAVALLGTAAVAYTGTRALGIGPAAPLLARGVVSEQKPIVLADFGSATGDTLLARAITTALRVDLAESRRFALAEPGFVRQVLARMQRDPAAPLNAAAAAEVAVREGLDAVIAGEVNRIGSGFVLTARVVEVASDDAVVSVRETAADSAALLAAVDRLSGKLRERLGDALGSIAASKPLATMTTSSLDALRKHTQALHALYAEGDQEKGIALLEEAVALDSLFAMAHQALGMSLQYQPGQAQRAAEALSTAFRHRGRVTERERYLIEAAYYDNVAHEPENAILAYERLLDAYPHAQPISALNNLALLYEGQRDDARAAELYRRALAQDSLNFVPYINLAAMQVALGGGAAADSTLARLRATLPANPATPAVAALLAGSRGDYDAAEAELRALAESQRAGTYWRDWALLELAYIARIRGQLAHAMELVREIYGAHAAAGDDAARLTVAIEEAWLDAWFRGRPGSALQRIDRALAAHPLAELPAAARPYLPLALVYAVAGQPGRASERVAEFDTVVEPGTRRAAAQSRHLVLARIALAEGRGADALEASRAADAGLCRLCALPLLALAHEAAGEPDSAVAAYQRYVDTPALFRVSEADALWLPWVHERLADLLEAQGDSAGAAAHLARLAELWRDADPELRPRVAEARRRIEGLAGPG